MPFIGLLLPDEVDFRELEAATNITQSVSRPCQVASNGPDWHSRSKHFFVKILFLSEAIQT